MTISLSQATRFWQVVTDCLIELYSMPEATAKARVAALFRNSAALSDRLDPTQEWLAELIYHAEPITLASDLAGLPLPSDETSLVRYREICARTLLPLQATDLQEDVFVRPALAWQERKRRRKDT